MTALLSIIVFALIVLIILAGIGVFNLRCICNYCDPYRSNGNLSSINAIVSQILINRAGIEEVVIKIRDGVDDICTCQKEAAIKLELAEERLSDLEDEVDELPFPIEDIIDEIKNAEKPAFIYDENTTADEIREAYAKEQVAIECANKEEWLESIATVSEWSEVTTRDKKRPIDVDKIVSRYDDGDDFHCLQSVPLLLCAITNEEPGAFFVCGTLADSNCTEFHTVIPWGDIRELFISTPTEATEQTDEEFESAEVAKFVEETVEPHLPVNPEAVVEQPATEIPEEISTVEDAERYLDEQRAAETAEKASEDIPAAPVESDDTEDKGEADA
nr:MAG TPA: hypothetical protein [Caudoviricetes sp.]